MMLMIRMIMTNDTKDDYGQNFIIGMMITTIVSTVFNITFTSINP